MWKWLLAVVMVVGSARGVTLRGEGCVFEVELATLEVKITPAGGEAIVASRGQKTVAGVEVNCAVEGEDLVVTIKAERAGKVTFPVVPAQAGVKAWLLPTFEGVRVPAEDGEWQKFLADNSPMNTTADFSMPFVGLEMEGRTLTVLLENRFSNEVTFAGEGGRLAAKVEHEFTANGAPREIAVRFHVGGAPAIEPALYYRRRMIAGGEFVSLEEKIKATPRVERLVGAAHGYVWGDGISAGFLRKLKADGIERAALITGDLDLCKDPEVAKTAEELGYLFGPYDSYHSIHSPEARDTWVTAQFDQELYERGAVVRADGTKKAGFQKKGYILSSKAVWPYVAKRVDPMMARVPFSAWFVDCDADGELFDNYSSEFAATQAEDAAERVKRLKWLASAHGLVVGSERGSSFAAGAIHFAHGMLTPSFGWGDEELKDRKSKYWLGAYWPPTGPGIFLKSVPLKADYAKFYFDPRYRVPLFQAALHHSVVTTHHWMVGSLKFSDQIAARELLELLYACPPLYHLNEKQYKADRGKILRHYKAFAPLHRELTTRTMEGFGYLSEDRMVQETRWAGGRRVVVNFAEEAREVEGRSIPGMSAVLADGTVYTAGESLQSGL